MNEHAPRASLAERPRRSPTDLARVEGAALATPPPKTEAKKEASTEMAALDPEARRRALEHRIEATKERLIKDITRVRSRVTLAATRAQQGLTRTATRTVIAVGALLAIGLVALLVRRRQRRIRITWR